jgi:hypothetical protein
MDNDSLDTDCNDSRDVPPCPKERGEQERLPQGGPSFEPLVGARLALNEKPTKPNQTDTFDTFVFIDSQHDMFHDTV